MRRGLAKLAPPPSAASFSTFSGAGGFGRGRGRGTSPSPPVPGEPPSDEDPFVAASSSGIGRGRGRGRGDEPHPSSPPLPSFPSFFGSSQGRGRGGGIGMTSPDSPPQDSQNPDSAPKKPVFFSRYDQTRPDQMRPPRQDSVPRTPNMNSFVSALGRGRPDTEPVATKPDAGQADGNRQFVKREDAARRAMEVLSRSAPGPASGMMGRGGTERGGRGMQGRGRARGRGRGRERDAYEEFTAMGGIDLPEYKEDPEEEAQLIEEIGEERLMLYQEAFCEAVDNVLPSPAQDAYENAMRTNNMIEFEPEYLVKFDNPDLEEKPPMSVEEMLETVKPFMMAYEGFTSQEQWEEAVKDVMERLPKMKELMDMYCGPDQITAKQQQGELQRVASTLPANAPTSVKKFTDRVILSLQSNPGWEFHRKCQFMDKLAWEVNQHYK